MVTFANDLVSRRHCEFFLQDGEWFVRDTNSLHGTYLNQFLISDHPHRTVLFPVQDGDIVQLGTSVMLRDGTCTPCIQMSVKIHKFVTHTNKQRDLANMETTVFNSIMS